MHTHRTDSGQLDDIAFSTGSRQHLEAIANHLAAISNHMAAIRETTAGGREDLRDRELRELQRSAAIAAKADPSKTNIDQGSVSKLIFSDRFLILAVCLAIIAIACAILAVSGHPDTAGAVIDTAKGIATGNK